MSDTQIENTRKSLERIQTFDARTLPRVTQLGEALSFEEAVKPADRLISLFKQYPSEHLTDLPNDQLRTIRGRADATFNIFDEILKFDPKNGDPNTTRTNLISQLRDTYQPTFSELNGIISYGASRQRDFAAMEANFRATIQRSSDEAQTTTQELAKLGEEAKRILDEVRKVAAEQGVSQKAHYFNEESKYHAQKTSTWRNWTIITAFLLIIYAAASVFFHKIPLLTPSNTYETIQIVVSKILIFTVLGYMLLLCAKNFLTHAHNDVVNKHRQNALLTFNALVDAAGTDERRDVILTYAAACIFNPQETGYVRGATGQSEMPMNIIQAIPKIASNTPSS